MSEFAEKKTPQMTGKLSVTQCHHCPTETLTCFFFLKCRRIPPPEAAFKKKTTKTAVQIPYIMVDGPRSVLSVGMSIFCH